MGDSVFFMCEVLERVVFAKGSRLEQIGENCFYDSSLEEFIAPPGLKEIKDGTFKYCWNLKRVVLNEGLAVLGENNYVFQDSGFEEITLPSTLEKIGNRTFKNCDRLQIVWVAKGCTLNIRQYVRARVIVLPAQAALGGKLL